MKKSIIQFRILLIILAIFLINTSILLANEDFKAWEFKTGHNGIACGNLGFTDHSLTVEFWINMAQTAATTESTNVIETFGDPYGFIINIRKNSANNNALELRLFAKDRQATPGTIYFFIPSDKYTDKWVHIAFVISETEQKAYAYINGNRFAETNAVGGYYGNYKSDGTTTRALNIGGAFWSSPKFLGKLADLRIWSVARSAQQIKENYNKHIEGTVPGLFINYKFLTYERGLVNDANPLVATNKGWCNPSTNWNTFYATESLATYPRNLTLSNGLLQWNINAGSWEVTVYKTSDNTNVFTDTISTNSISVRNISKLNVGTPYYSKIRTLNNGFSSNSVTSDNFSIDRHYRYNGSGSWHNLSNWENSYDNVNWTNASIIPNATSATSVTIQGGKSAVIDANTTVNNLIINAGGNLIINKDVTANINALTLESNSNGTATLVDNYESPTVNANVQQYVESGRNWYVSSPVAEADFSALNKGAYVTAFNEVNKSWETISSGKLIPGKGYIQVANASQGTTGNIVFNGLLNAGNITVPLSRTESGSNIGFNLVGNPYPSYLDWSKVSAANQNVLPTAWFRTKKTIEAGGGYTFATVNVGNEIPIIVNGEANTKISSYIPPMQAYWVRLITNPTTTNYTVTNEMRDRSDNIENRLKAPRQINLSLVRLQLTSGKNTDETVIYFNEKATDNFDRFDSPKMLNTTTPNIYTTAGTEKLVINGMNSMAFNKPISLGFTTETKNNFSISATEITNFNTNVKLILRDNLLGYERDLTAGEKYDFSSDTIHSSDRFSLVFRLNQGTTGFENETNSDFYTYKNTDGNIAVGGNTSLKNNYTASIFNSLGQKLETITLIGSETFFRTKFTKGIYVISIISGKECQSRKIIID